MKLKPEMEPNEINLAQRFLQTAVIVDDQAYMRLETNAIPNANLVTPDRSTLSASQNNQDVSDNNHQSQKLNAESIMNGFSELGIICSVIDARDSVLKTIRLADIVILDWLLKNNEPYETLKLIQDLLAKDADRNSLRLLAIYTGQATLEEISKTVFEVLKNEKLDPKHLNNNMMTISYRHGRVELYAKPGVNLSKAIESRKIQEAKLPEKLLKDFAMMTKGLLPNIALTSLSAIREGSHKVLDRFNAKLDPAFLAHRTCLPHPSDAEIQIVNHIAEEFRSLMVNTVVDESPAGEKAVVNWINVKNRGSTKFKFNEQEFDLEKTIQLANEPLKMQKFISKNYKYLSAGFSGENIKGLDEELAWIMSFRTVYNAPCPNLWQGTVIKELSCKGERYMICMRQRCDCVRLKEETRFHFLPIEEKSNKHKELIVIRSKDKFILKAIEIDPKDWIFLKFKPSSESDSIIAERGETDGEFVFSDVGCKKYIWQGELKENYALRIAQAVSTKLSRIAIDESEWLRRASR